MYLMYTNVKDRIVAGKVGIWIKSQWVVQNT